MGRLVKFLAVKSVLELGFVAGLAINFYLAAFPTSFRGSLDDANPTQIAGWVFDMSAPEATVMSDVAEMRLAAPSWSMPAVMFVAPE